MPKYVVTFLIVFVQVLSARQLIVAESGGDYTSIQAALNATQPGDSILVKEKSTPYYEKINIPHGGDAITGYITLMAFPGSNPVIVGTNVPNNPASYTDDLVYMENISYFRIIGFEIRNVNTPEGSGIRVYGSGSYIEILNNEIHEIRGGSQDGGAMGITVYGADDNQPISHITIDGNHIHDCDPAWSEALTLNGNVEQFEVTNNIVEDVNNIGIDFIGGEDWLSTKYARNGRCAWNQVYRANASYEDGYAAGIYVDGGQNIVVENNIVSECDLGIEIGAENEGVVTSGIKVRNNIVYQNGKAGLVFGGYDVNTGRTKNCSFTGNTCYQNDQLNTGHGELWIQYAEDNDIRNNIFYATAQNILLYSESGNINNSIDYNLWYCTAGENSGIWVWNSSVYQGFSAYKDATGQDEHSLFSDPQFIDATNANFHISGTSAAIDHGDPAFVPDSNETDMDGQMRLVGNRVDIGADEIGATSLIAIKPMPNQFLLIGAYPNPFNPQTEIRYYLPRTQKIQIKIFDNLGRLLRTLADSNQPAGQHSVIWNGRNNQGTVCPSGTYFIRVSNGQRVQSLKLMLLK